MKDQELIELYAALKDLYTKIHLGLLNTVIVALSGLTTGILLGIAIGIRIGH